LIQAQLAQDAAKTADIMNDLAVLAALENDAQLAKATANEAFNDRLAIFGDMSEQTAESLNTLGLASIAGMDYAEAQRYAMRALSIESGDPEKNALRIADSYDILAQAYFEEGDLVQAERLAKQALEIHSRALSPSNPASARDVFILANVELQAGHAAKAAELLEQSVDVSDDLQKTHSVLGLAIVAAAKGDMVHSRELFQRSINLAVRQFGDDSSIVVGMKALYVKVLWDQGRWIDALQVRGDLPDTRKTIDDLLVEDSCITGKG
jgi:tetratricopeptide (TPR) repeat protein